MAKQNKDTIQTLYIDLVRQIKENEELIGTDFGKQQLKSAKRQLKNILMATEGMSAKERLSFTRNARNTIKMLSGDDYYFTVDDGFEIYKIKKSTIENKKDKTVEYLLTRFKNSIGKAQKEIRKDVTTDKEVKENQIDALNRLRQNVNKNIELFKTDSEYFSMDKNLDILNDEAYPIFQDVVSMSISLNI